MYVPYNIFLDTYGYITNSIPCTYNQLSAYLHVQKVVSRRSL